ncbi:MAG: class I SAM-dependent methyltransferase [Verrucomicrobia bacterium]|jgi:SAM-dependent methyltransferase|nr:class I SAM-dependent methyltransferase [Verrucomicrobiota bacterium]
MDKLVETRRERFWNPDALRRDQWIFKHASRLREGSRVLDAGAGSSKYRPYFKLCRYETQDFCQYEGELVRYRQPIDHVCDITQIPIGDAAFDCILCVEVLEHVVDPVAVLREFSRLMKPGGLLLLTAPQGSMVHMEPHHYYGGFSHYWYKHWIPQCGFKLESVTPQSGPGRVAVYGLEQLYLGWRTWERTLPLVRRTLSLVLRIAFWKLPVHYIVPLTARWFDKRLPGEACGIGLMVAATRLPADAR